MESKVDRRDEAETRGEEPTAADARHRDDAVLERLGQRLEHRARELGKLVEKKHASMRECPECPSSFRAHSSAHDQTL